MIRAPMVLAGAVVLTLAGSAVAGAEPSPSPCSYRLSPPQVVQLSGTNAVTATLSPASCDRSVAYLTVACVQLQGSDGPGQCQQQNGILTAQVFYQPYRPEATYIATGTGCANTGNPRQPVCQPMGPLTATL
ncbi:MAG TPA: hypothetical protein VER34_12490 [Mycobacterium sp.]|nr:hypothetical protein [Mycobacterium sp.]